MGWITIGEIQIYSISDDISFLASNFFDLLKVLINPFFYLITGLFIATMIFYIIFNLSKHVEHAGEI